MKDEENCSNGIVTTDEMIKFWQQMWKNNQQNSTAPRHKEEEEVHSENNQRDFISKEKFEEMTQNYQTGKRLALMRCIIFF